LVSDDKKSVAEITVIDAPSYPRRKKALQVLKNNLAGVWIQE
jgi:hypothetical protein